MAGYTYRFEIFVAILPGTEPIQARTMDYHSGGSNSSSGSEYNFLESSELKKQEHHGSQDSEKQEDQASGNCNNSFEKHGTKDVEVAKKLSSCPDVHRTDAKYLSPSEKHIRTAHDQVLPSCACEGECTQSHHVHNLVPDIPYNWLEPVDTDFIWHDTIQTLGRLLEDKKYLLVLSDPGQGKNCMLGGYMRLASKMVPAVYSNGLYWVDASSRENLKNQLAHLAKPMGINNNIPCDTQSLVSEVRSWLQRHSNWLLVFYGADRKKVVNDIEIFYSGDNRCEPLRNGHIIIASYRENDKFNQMGFETFKVAPLAEEKCRKLILGKLKTRMQTDEGKMTDTEKGALNDTLRICQGLTIRFMWVCEALLKQNKFNSSFESFRKYFTAYCSKAIVKNENIENVFALLNSMAREESMVTGLMLDLVAFCHTTNIPLNMFVKGAHGFFKYAKTLPWTMSVPAEELEVIINEGQDKALVKVLELLEHAAKMGSLIEIFQRKGEYFLHMHIAVQQRLQIGALFDSQMLLKMLSKMFLHMFSEYHGDVKTRKQILPHCESVLKHMKRSISNILYVEEWLDLYIKLKIEVIETYAIQYDMDSANYKMGELEKLLENKRLQKLSHPEMYTAFTFSTKAILLIWQGHEPEGIEASYKALHIYNTLSESEELLQKMIDTHKWLTYALIEIENLDRAREELSKSDNLLKRLEQIENPNLQRKILRHKAHNICQMYKLNKMEAYKIVYTHARGRMSLSNRREFLKKLEAARDMINEALDLCEQSGYGYRHVLYKMFSCEMEAKIALETVGNKRPEFRDKVIQLKDCLNEIQCNFGLFHRYMVWVKCRIAWALLKLGDERSLGEAKTTIDESIQLQERSCTINDHPRLADLLLIKGQIQLVLQLKEDALDTLNEARRLYIKHKRDIMLERVIELIEYAEGIRYIDLEADDILNYFESKSIYNHWRVRRLLGRSQSDSECIAEHDDGNGNIPPWKSNP